MEVFDKLEALATDDKTAFLAIRASQRAARDVLNAIGERFKTEHAQAEDRASELWAKIDDPACSETVRRMARAELEALGLKTFESTSAELKAFEDALQDLDQAIADAGTLRKQIADQLKAATEAIAEIRNQTIGSQTNDLTLLSRYPANLRAEFADLLNHWRMFNGKEKQE